MAQYKVIQDIEAEDKLVGPFSLRQFIYAAIAALFGYLSVIAVGRGGAFLLAIFVPPMLFCMFFAWPWSPDQPTEVWALARIRFYFKSRKRIWDQAGVKDLVTITAPKQVQKVFTDGLSQTEVKSRLAALAETIDSRGRVITDSETIKPSPIVYDQSASDRLVPTGAMPQPVSDIHASDDIMDEQNNAIAHQFDEMIQASSTARREKLMQQMRTPQQPGTPSTTQATQPPADYWFLNQQNDTPDTAFANPSSAQPGVPATATPTNEDATLLAQTTAQQHAQSAHLKTINPLDPAQVNAVAQTQKAATVPVTAQSDAAILNLATNNDLDVATIARQAKKAREPELPDDEVVISLRQT